MDVSNDAARVLVVDDDAFIRVQVRGALADDGLDVETVDDGNAALDLLRARPFDVVVTDMRMPGLDGLALLAAVRRERIAVGLVFLTGYGDTRTAIDAMKAGADDFVAKPFDVEHLRRVVRRIIERRRLVDELARLRKHAFTDHGVHDMVSKSPKMMRIFDLVEQVGPSGSTVLIQGETGTGKELVARALHAADNRGRRGFHAVNCAALHDQLLESELFGHEAGAFTGADRRKTGRFEQADGGTLLLDEIGEISLATQAKLLRILQTGRCARVGGGEPIPVDVRVLAATNRPLDLEVKAGRFRADLYYRLQVVSITLPPLRERREDVTPLAFYFLEKFRSMSTPAVTGIEPAAMQALLDYHWPGNVRELENAIKSAVALAPGTTIHERSLPSTIAQRAAGLDLEPAADLIDLAVPLPELTERLLARVEREYLRSLMRRMNGNIARAARQAGLSRRGLTQKLGKHNLNRRQFQ